MLSGERLLKRLRHYPDIPGGAENEISPYPAKGYGGISFSESAVSRRIIFPVGLALFLRHGGAD